MKRVIQVAALSALVSGSVSAATLTATFDGDFDPGFNAPQVDGTTAFVIEFDDGLGTQDGVFEYNAAVNELLSFTWINDPFAGSRDLLRAAPDIPGVSDGEANNDIWVFTPGSFTFSTVSADQFTYSITDDDPPPVPLPAGAVLMVSGLAGMGLLRRRRRGSE